MSELDLSGQRGIDKIFSEIEALRSRSHTKDEAYSPTFARNVVNMNKPSNDPFSEDSIIFSCPPPWQEPAVEVDDPFARPSIEEPRISGTYFAPFPGEDGKPGIWLGQEVKVDNLEVAGEKEVVIIPGAVQEETVPGESPELTQDAQAGDEAPAEEPDVKEAEAVEVGATDALEGQPVEEIAEAALENKADLVDETAEEDVKDVAVATPEPAAVSVQEVPVKEDCKDLRQRVEGLKQLVLDLQASLKAKERALQDWEERFQVQAEKKVTPLQEELVTLRQNDLNQKELLNQLQDKLETQSRKAAECEAAIEEASEKTNKDFADLLASLHKKMKELKVQKSDGVPTRAVEEKDCSGEKVKPSEAKPVPLPALTATKAADAENQSPVAPTLEDWRFSHLVQEKKLVAVLGKTAQPAAQPLVLCSPRTSRSPSPQGTPELKAERVPEPFTSPLLRRCSMLHGVSGVGVSPRLSRSPSPVPRSPSPELPRPLVWQAPQAPQPAFVFGQQAFHSWRPPRVSPREVPMAVAFPRPMQLQPRMATPLRPEPRPTSLQLQPPLRAPRAPPMAVAAPVTAPMPVAMPCFMRHATPVRAPRERPPMPELSAGSAEPPKSKESGPRALAWEKMTPRRVPPVQV